MDCTYKTNKHGLSLLNITGMTASNSTFFVAVGLICDEKQESYSYILANMKQIYIDLRINHTGPDTVVIDRDLASIAALETTFRHTDRILCRWHINKAIEDKAKENIFTTIRRPLSDPIYKGTEAEKTIQDHVFNIWDQILKALNKVIYQKTRDDLYNEWKKFKLLYKTYGLFLSYMEKDWLYSRHAKSWLPCYLNDYLYFDQISTSRNEGSHWVLKRDGAATQNLLVLVQDIGEIISRRHRAINHELALQRVRKPIDLIRPLFRAVQGKISKEALRIVIYRHDLYLKYGPYKQQISPCTGIASRTTGIPCIYIIQACLESSLQVSYFHHQW
jgi:hypothetical protein